MPYDPHPLFQEPADRDAPIWRYMSFSKYVALLQTKALFFARADTLAKDDPFEGSLTHVNYNNRPGQRAALAALIREQTPSMTDEDVARVISNLKYFDHRRKIYMPKCAFINCWHGGGDESDALWKLYGGTEGGICVESTFNRLTAALAAFAEKILIGRVQYLDYHREAIDEENVLAPFICKRRSFQHEIEVRALLYRFQTLTDENFENVSIGINVPVEIDHLVARVHISPLAPSWLHEVVKNVSAAYQFGGDIQRSRLAELIVDPDS